MAFPPETCLQTVCTHISGRKPYKKNKTPGGMKTEKDNNNPRKKKTVSGIRKVPINTHGQTKFTACASVANKELREEQSERQKQQKKLWASAQEIPEDTEETFTLTFSSEMIYLGRLDLQIASPVMIGGRKKAFMLPSQCWLTRNKIQYGKKYTCARKKSSDTAYGKIPVFYVLIMEEEKTTHVEEKPMPTEKKLGPIPECKESIVISFDITVLKTEIKFDNPRTATQVLSFIKGQKTSVEQEDSSRQLEIESKLAQVDWRQANNVILFLHRKRFNPEKLSEYETCLLRLIAKFEPREIVAESPTKPQVKVGQTKKKGKKKDEKKGKKTPETDLIGSILK